MFHSGLSYPSRCFAAESASAAIKSIWSNEQATRRTLVLAYPHLGDRRSIGDVLDVEVNVML
jgi:hypothetical protein